jgi:toxin HigB-1
VLRAIRHKGLKRLYEHDDSRGVAAEHVEKLRDILARLDAAQSIKDMDIPGFRLHLLKRRLERFLRRHRSRQLARDISFCRG